MKVKSDHLSKFSNLSNGQEEAWKNQGFNRIRTCDLREMTWSDLREMTWSLYEIIHICTVVADESEEWSSQWIFQCKQLERRSLK